MKTRQLTETERVLRSRHKHNHVQVLFKKEHRAQIRLIAHRQQKTFVKFLEDAMEHIIAQSKRRYGPSFARELDQAKDAALQPARSRSLVLSNTSVPIFPPVRPAKSAKRSK
ncbi:MAG: hypothetical protein ACYC9L_03050 [Sulfuricaulis sp.]